MADIKWSAFPSTTSAASGDSVVGLHSGANERFLVSATPVASGLTLWDANRNLSGNNIIPGFTSTATTGGTTTLLPASTYQQYFTGSAAQTVLLPDVTLLVAGESFYIVNKSAASITVSTSLSGLVQTMDSNSAALFTCVATSGITPAVWNVEYAVSQSGVTQRQVQTSAFNFAAGGGSTNAFVVNLNPAVVALTDGMLVTMLASDFNTSTTPTLQINSLSPKTIVNDLGPLAAEDITVDGIYLFVYNSVNDNFVLINPSITNANAYLVQKNYFNYSPDIGAANAYVVNLVLVPLVALTGGLSVISQMAHANTGPSTLTLNGHTAPIVNLNGGALIANEIILGGISEFIYSDNYSSFVLMNSAIFPGTGTVSSGLANQLAYYATTGTVVSGLSSANNGMLVTSGSGVPSIGNSVGANCSFDGVMVGQGSFADGFNSNTTLGNSALVNNASGIGNTAVGTGALQGVETGSNNTSVGSLSSLANDGSNNVYIGAEAGQFLGTATPGSNNTLAGAFLGNGGAVSGSIDMLSGSDNTWIGYYVCGSDTNISGTIAIGKYSLPDPSTGATSSDTGPSIAIGAATVPVGFRGDATAYPAGAANYWRMKVNGSYFKIPILPDGTTIQWPASGTLATTGASPQWINVTAATTTIVPGAWYIANYTGGITVFNLPTTAAFGTDFKIKGGLAGSGWQITQGAGQQINVGIDSSTLGVTGSLNSTSSTDYVSLTCLTANLYFSDTGFTGSLNAL